MAGKDRISTDALVEQWLFDYFVDKCVSKSVDNGEMDDSSRRILETLMLQLIDPDYGQNKVKANLLMVIDFQQQLTEFDIDCPEKRSKLLGSQECVSELFDLMDGLRNSIQFLRDRRELQSKRICALCKMCLLRSYVYVFQILHSLRHGPDPLFEVSQLEGWTSTILGKLEKYVDSASEEEQSILQTCKDLFKGNNVQNDLPPVKDLITLLTKLISKVHGLLAEPDISKLAESYMRMHSKLEEIQDEDLLSFRPNSKSSLEKLGQLNKSKSGDDNRSRKTKKLLSLKLLQESQSQDTNCHKSRESSSDLSSEGSTPVETTQSPQKRPEKTNVKSKSKSPVAKPQASGVLKRSINSDNHSWNAKSKKPTSHIRVSRGPWTPHEEEVFVLSVLRIGVGKWAEVKEDIQAERSSVQLKDKWRNITKSRIRSIAHEHGLSVPRGLK